MYISDMTSKIVYILITIFLLFLAFYNIFHGLSDFPIYSWDEARHGVSAYEMLRNGNYIVNTYKNKIDYWNLKPPLSFLMTIAGFKLAGINTLGLRLFSATFAILTILIIFLFVLKRHGILSSFLSALALSTSAQFLINHSARTADADSLFVFLFTSSILSLLLSGQTIKWLYVSAATSSLAFLTKSWHAGNIFIIMFLYLMITGIYKRIAFKNWMLIFCCLTGPIISWGLFRYHYDGIEFFEKMIAYDLLKRSSTTIEGHVGSRLYYLEILWRFSKLWLILLISFTLIFLYKNFARFKPNAYITGLCLWISIPLILYSLAETKIRWYILPIYPAIAISIGILGAYLIHNARIGIKLAIFASILFVSATYELQILSYIQHPIPKLHLSLVEKIKSVNEVKGFNLYVYPHAKNVWTQNTVLAAELYGDLKVKDGGLKTFLKNEKALLLLKKTRKTEQLIKANNLIIVTSNKWGYIVRKAN